MLKKASLRQNKRNRKCPLFSFESSNWPQFYFILQFSYEMKHMVCFSKPMREIFHFQFRFIFVKVYFFVQQITSTLRHQNFITPFKIKVIEKSQTVLLLDFWLLSSNKKFWNSMVSLQNLTGDKFCKLRKSKYWERQVFQ